ncbi:MAG: hypothetical protein L0287_32400 [Anaerolineae bacterium]|nr:hypothetical protein [Anaerolineae bacterium]
MYSLFLLDEQRRIIAYLDGLPPTGDASQQAKVNALRELLSPKGDASQSASGMPYAEGATVGRAFKGEL